MNTKFYQLLIITLISLLGTSTWAQPMSPATPEAACDPVSASTTRSRALSLPADAPTLRQNIFRLQAESVINEDVKVFTQLYQTQWDLAKQLATQPNQLSNAIATYEQAQQTLRKLRSRSLTNQDKPSKETLEKFYYCLIDLYLRQAEQQGVIEEKRDFGKNNGYLSKAIDTLESFKQAELQSYFQDDCLVKEEKPLDTTLIKLWSEEKMTSTELAQTTILYPIFFPAQQGFERTLELLLIRFQPTATKNGYEAKIIWKQSPVTKPAERLQEIDVQCFRELVEANSTLESCADKPNDTRQASDSFKLVYKKYGEKLYKHLLEPLTKELKDTKTLVFVPDGELYSIPLTALLDPNQTDTTNSFKAFVLFKPYAIVTVPGLTLAKIDRPDPLIRKSPRLLLGGINETTETDENKTKLFGNLHANTALPMLQEIYDRNNTVLFLLDKNFSINDLRQAMQDQFHNYNIMHLHTHGVFGSAPDATQENSGGKQENSGGKLCKEEDTNKPKKEYTYLVTSKSEEYLTMDKLSEIISLGKRRDSPIELLTFGACQTAKGDKTSAFGLAGAAFQSGAKSIVATLWNANEYYTARFMALFYTQLRGDHDHREQTKAQALQLAQRQLVKIAICGVDYSSQKNCEEQCGEEQCKASDSSYGGDFQKCEEEQKKSVNLPFCCRKQNEKPTLVSRWAPFILIGNWF